MTTPPEIDPETIGEFTTWRDAQGQGHAVVGLLDFIAAHCSVGLAAAYLAEF